MKIYRLPDNKRYCIYENMPSANILECNSKRSEHKFYLFFEGQIRYFGSDENMLVYMNNTIHFICCALDERKRRI